MSDDKNKNSDNSILFWGLVVFGVYLAPFFVLCLDAFCFDDRLYMAMDHQTQEVFEKIYWPLIQLVQWMIGAL